MAEAAPVTSLADHGISNPRQMQGRWWIHAYLPATFAKGDDLSMDHWGPYPDGTPSGRRAIVMASMDILMVLVLIAIPFLAAPLSLEDARWVSLSDGSARGLGFRSRSERPLRPAPRRAVRRGRLRWVGAR